MAYLVSGLELMSNVPSIPIHGLSDLLICSIGWAWSSTDPDVLIPKIMAQYKSLAENIYAKGGRKFLFLNVPPTSRAPQISGQGADVAKGHAAWLAAFNNALKSMVNEFIAENSGVRSDVAKFPFALHD